MTAPSETSPTPKPSEAETNSTELGFDALVEDIFGLNWRGLKTIWTLIRRPHAYFEAAKTPKWRDRYTPSFRIWFSIIAIGTFLQFIWAGENSAMFNAYKQIMIQIVTDANTSLAPRDLMIDPEAFDSAASAKMLIKYSQLFLPLGYLITLLGVAALFHSWGEKLSFVIRLRYVFAIIIPGSLIGFIFAIATLKVPLEIFQVVNALGIGLMIITYALVAYFGPFRGMKTSLRLGRTLGITVLIAIAVLVATVISTTLAFIPVVTMSLPPPVPLIG